MMKTHQVDCGLITSPIMRDREGWRDVVFSLHDARRALRYVAKLAADAAEAFREIHDTREALSQIVTMGDHQLRKELCERRDRAISQLNLAIDDCNAVGAHLVDLPNGQLSLPALVGGCPVSLVWRIGDEIGDAWSDLPSD